MTLHEMLEKARASAQKLQPSEAAVLFAAAVRLAAARGATLRARLIEIDEAGALHLLPFDENAPEPTPSYLAPELLAPGAPRKNEPRVQVYAAGALGYELLTGKHAPSGPAGAELGGPLGDIVRIALSADRRERFGDMNQLQDALSGVQPRPPAEGERNILVSLRTRFARRPPEKEAVARLIEKVAALEQQIGKVHARTESLREGFERFEEGERRRAERKPQSSAVPGLVAGIAGAALVLAIAWAMGFIGRGGTASAENARADGGGMRAAESTDAGSESAQDEGSIAGGTRSRDSGTRAAGSRAGAAGAGAVGAGAVGNGAARAGSSAAAARQQAATQRAPDAGPQSIGVASQAASGADASTVSAQQASDNSSAAGTSDNSPAAGTFDSAAGAPDDAVPTETDTAPSAGGSDTAAAARQTAASDGGSQPSAAGGPQAATGTPDASTAARSTAPASSQSSPDGGTQTAAQQSRRAARGTKQKGVSTSAINHALALSEVRRGESALEHGHADDAVSSFRSALDNEPGIAVAYRGLGLAYGVQGNDAEALRAYEKYLQLMPHAKDAQDIRKSMAEIRDRGKLGEEK